MVQFGGMQIRPPQLDRNHNDYPAECESALEHLLRDLIDEAAQTGWMAPVTFGAIERLVAKQRLAYGLDPTHLPPGFDGKEGFRNSSSDQRR